MTISLGDISIRYINLLLQASESIGIDTEPYCRQFQLSPTKREQADARLSIPKFMRLGQTLIAEHRCPELGLLCGPIAQPSLLSWVGFLAECAPSLDQALIDMAGYERLSGRNARGQSRFYREGPLAVAEFYSISPYNEFNHFIVDLALATKLAMVQRLAGSAIQPLYLQIEFPAPTYVERYSQLLPCPVRFNQARNALVYKHTDLQAAPRQANANAYQDCRDQCDALLRNLERQQSFVERVMQEISPLLNSNQLSLAQVAEGLEMPPWTLRRRLSAEGTRFSTLVEQTRADLARIYLKDPLYSLGEITYLLGYANPNAFQRAFKRWQGEAPGAYRAGLTANG